MFSCSLTFLVVVVVVDVDADVDVVCSDPLLHSEGDK